MFVKTYGLTRPLFLCITSNLGFCAQNGTIALRSIHYSQPTNILKILVKNIYHNKSLLEHPNILLIFFLISLSKNIIKYTSENQFLITFL